MSHARDPTFENHAQTPEAVFLSPHEQRAPAPPARRDARVGAVWGVPRRLSGVEPALEGCSRSPQQQHAALPWLARGQACRFGSRTKHFGGVHIARGLPGSPGAVWAERAQLARRPQSWASSSSPRSHVPPLRWPPPPRRWYASRLTPSPLDAPRPAVSDALSPPCARADGRGVAGAAHSPGSLQDGPRRRRPRGPVRA